MFKLFTEHPRTVGETYGRHWLYATKMGTQLILAGLYCIIHAIFPFIFQFHGSQLAEKIAKKLHDRRIQSQRYTG